jgi:hypothetical protein
MLTLRVPLPTGQSFGLSLWLKLTRGRTKLVLHSPVFINTTTAYVGLCPSGTL